MKNIKWKTVITAAAFAVLIMLFAALSAKYVILKREYGRYRGSVLSRSCEMLVESLCDYRETKEPYLAERIAFSVSNLPLTRECHGYATEFCADISHGRSDEKAQKRALKYCDTLIFFISENRESIYQNNAVALPAYPSGKDSSVPTAVIPAEGDKEVRKNLRKQAEKLFDRSYGISEYSRKDGKSEILGFRTVNSYAEYDLSTRMLVKAIIYRAHSVGDALPENELVSFAEQFLSEQGYLSAKLSGVSHGYGTLTAVFDASGRRVTASVSETDGRTVSFIAE